MKNLKKLLPIIIIVLYIFAPFKFYAQLGNNNTNLLANLNQHSGSAAYSACWGYVAPNGREYAILGCYNGTSFVDITDSSNIHEVSYIPGPAFSSGYTWREMKTFSHYAYIVTDVTASAQGVQIDDLQYLPDSVHFVGYYNFSGYARSHTIQQSGPYLYINGGNYSNEGTFILDLTSNPTLPVKRGQWETYYVHDCRVVNDTIYACNIYNPPGSISVIDATNKDNPQTITSWVNNPNPFPHNCAITTDRRYIFTTDETETPNGKLKVWDILNLSNVTLITSWQPTGITTAIVHNVEIYGNIAVVAHYTAGIRILNISNPTNPIEVAWYDTYPSSNANIFNGCWGVYMFPSGKVIGSDLSTGLYVIRPTISLTGLINNNSIPEMFLLKQNYPNPFNPSTNIEYSLPQNGYVSLKIYNIQGKLSGTIVDEYKTAGGYKIRFDASRFSSGIYFYSLQEGSSIITKKMILIK